MSFLQFQELPPFVSLLPVLGLQFGYREGCLDGLLRQQILVAIQSPEEQLGASLLLFLTTIYLTNLQMINQLPQAHFAEIPCCFSTASWFILCQDSWSYTACLLPHVVTITPSFICAIQPQLWNYHWIVQAQFSTWVSASHIKHKLLRNCVTGTSCQIQLPLCRCWGSRTMTSPSCLPARTLIILAVFKIKLW